MPGLSPIPIKQNSTNSLELLAASSQFYGWAKRALAAQITLTVGLPVLTAVIAILYPDFKIWAAFIGTTVTWLDVLIIDKVQGHFRKMGALAQEELDCDLFGLPWNELRCGKRLNKEDVHGAAVRFDLGKNGKEKKDWYPVEVTEIPEPFASLICQRSCFWWDAGQRRIYGYYLVGFVALVLIGIGVWSLSHSQKLSDLILGVYAPLAPAIIWSVREAIRQRDAAAGLERAQGVLQGTWEKALGNSLSPEECSQKKRAIQDALFEGRSRNPLIFNWVYRYLRTYREFSMKKAARSLIDDARLALSLPAIDWPEFDKLREGL